MKNSISMYLHFAFVHFFIYRQMKESKKPGIIWELRLDTFDYRNLEVQIYRNIMFNRNYGLCIG